MTKADAVDIKDLARRFAIVTEELESNYKNSYMTPIFMVSSYKNKGVTPLRDQLVSIYHTTAEKMKSNIFE
jgi:selenocysteine-specific translation elongation factor